MKLSDFALTEVYKMLKGLNDEESIWYVDYDLSIFKYLKPDNKSPRYYITLNTLPISSGVLQKCYLNVNCHAVDLGPGQPDMEALNQVSNNVLNMLDNVTRDVETTTMLVDFETEETFRESSLKEHYKNLRFSVKIINR